MIPWREAWQAALYGPDGFYRLPEGPIGHFTTSAHPPLGRVFAQAVAALADREGVCRVVDFACGRGELLVELSRIRPDLALVGVDVVARPPGLPAVIDWVTAPGGADVSWSVDAALATAQGSLIIANEWLDVVPCAIAEVDAAGTLCEVLVDPDTGVESLGDALTGLDLAWVESHWPLRDRTPGNRVEAGLARDQAWAALCHSVAVKGSRSVVVALDYGHTIASRPSDGTLMGYAHGLPTAAVPDGSCDLTAHVAMDSLPGATVTTQRAWILDLLSSPDNSPVTASSPTNRDLASTDPAAYLEALSQRSALAQLADPHGLGGFLVATRRLP